MTVQQHSTTSVLVASRLLSGASDLQAQCVCRMCHRTTMNHVCAPCVMVDLPSQVMWRSKLDGTRARCLSAILDACLYCLKCMCCIQDWTHPAVEQPVSGQGRRTQQHFLGASVLFARSEVAPCMTPSISLAHNCACRGDASSQWRCLPLIPSLLFQPDNGRLSP